LIFGVPAKIAGDKRAKRNDAEMIGACEIERGTHKFCTQALACERLRNFGMVEDEVAGKKAIGQHGELAVNMSFEALSGFVVFEGDAVEV
jgi:hypothetical protein